MKPLAFALCVCAFIGYSIAADAKEEFQNRLKSHHEACVKESGVAPEIAAKSMQGELVEDKKLNCFMKCVFVKMGYMSNAGGINADYMKKNPRPDIDPAKVSGLVDKCKAPAGADACEKAMNMAKCFQNNSKN